jgi:hypothetical protein
MVGYEPLGDLWHDQLTFELGKANPMAFVGRPKAAKTLPLGKNCENVNPSIAHQYYRS